MDIFSLQITKYKLEFSEAEIRLHIQMLKNVNVINEEMIEFRKEQQEKCESILNE